MSKDPIKQAEKPKPSMITDNQVDAIVNMLILRLSEFGMVDKLITKAEAAKFLRVSYKTFERRLGNGHYPSWLIHWDDGTMLFLPSQLVQFVKTK